MKYCTTISWIALIMLMTQNLIASPMNLELELPQELKTENDGEIRYSYTPDGFRQVLRIYATYVALAESHVLLIEDIEALETKNDLLMSGVDTCIETLNDVNRDREFVYSLKTQRDWKRPLIVGLSAGVAGVGVGILVGVLVTR